MPEMDSAEGSEEGVSGLRRRLAPVWDGESLEDGALRLFASALIDLAVSLVEEAEDEKEEAA